MNGAVMAGLARAESDVNSGVGDLDGLPEIYIRAVNPGYKIDGVSNVGEMIEITRRDKDSDTPILLAGIKLSYTNSSGNTSVLVEFPEYSYMTGEKILLQLASSPMSELAALRYKTTLGTNGGIKLIRGEEVLDEVCWTGKEGCYKKFNTSKPTSLVRNTETRLFEHVEGYEPEYLPEAYTVNEPEEPDEGYGEVMGKCKGLEFSELLSYYAETKQEQFVEFVNAGTETIVVDGCYVRYKNKDYPLTGQVKSEGYLVRWMTDFNVTKNPTNTNVLELIDANGEVLDRLEYPNGQRKGTAWALIGYDAAGAELWRTTYAVTPGEANIYQEYKSCEEGKVINEETGNCVKVTEVSVKTCPEGQYLNPLTGRCRKIETEEEKECAEGYELNPETGRCRKVKVNNGADYELTTENYEESSSFVALYVVLGVVGVGIIYIIWEFRREIVKLWRKVGRRFRP